ncbi:hypothetical protein P4E94_08145 [Pontiellaceae bacterium B12219]|nr:hypothetical protein [Pontiellaceae bacterium B12219]
MLKKIFISLLWITVVVAEETPLHKQVEDHLAEANRLRSARDAEYRAWQDNRARMETLIGSIEAAAAQQRVKAEADRRQTERFSAVSKELMRTQEAGENISRVCIELMNEVHATLDQISLRSIPGTVPEMSKPYGELKEQWQQAMSRWKATEDASRNIEVRTMVGLLGNRAVKVKALLVGTTLGWWLDETTGQTGFLIPPADAEGGVELVAFPRAGKLQAELRKAFQIVEGRRAPHWVYLPFQEVGR